MLINDLDKLHKVRSVENGVLAVRQTFYQKLVLVLCRAILVLICCRANLEPVEAQNFLV